ncbi:substrate-binding domain-containing protein [Nitrospirillum sp. BR 11164]|uniref:substrate-binding domain-containing protein n=1 Tax=Nitrospirillum sp. BR 11164 TaxID=3104324 RepID=UPI002AFF5489|nr:substrate-binding domain-containing protein [Nitrospirillum sp. BR 11164]MEA1651153.1 substrate-binding domain-containing protein [Nitrospirillum sp. BR 11164]
MPAHRPSARAGGEHGGRAPVRLPAGAGPAGAGGAAGTGDGPGAVGRPPGRGSRLYRDTATAGAVPRPDGLFCYNDPSALGAMRAVLEAGLRVPDDIAIIGCGNLSYADFLRVPLSSVDQGAEAIGRRVAELATSLAGTKNAAPPPHVDLVPPRLVARASTIRFPKG